MTMKPTAVEYLSCILFRVAKTHWAVDVAAVQRVHEQLTIHAVPGTQSWFLGLAQLDGELLPVTDLGAWVNQTPCAGAILHLHARLGPCGLRVDEVLGTQTLAPISAALDAATSVMPGAQAQMVQHNGLDFRQVDLSALVQSPAFIAVREASTA